MRPPNVLVVGDVMHDIVVRPSGPLRRGTDQRASIDIRPGGAGANQAAWLAHCGVSVRLLAAVAEADRATAWAGLAAAGIDPVLMGHPTLPTGRLIALLDGDGERSFLTDRGANDALAVDELPDDLLAGIVHLHVSGYALVGAASRASVRHLVGLARANGLAVSVDPGSAGFLTEVGAATFIDWMGPVDHCLANSDEAEVLTGTRAPEAQLAKLNEWSALAVLKQGAAGASVRDRAGHVWQERAPLASVVDTIGAGDAFLAGFLAARLAGADVGTSLRKAVAYGAAAVGVGGGRPPATKGLLRALP